MNNKNENIVIYGGGAEALVVIDIIEKMGGYTIVGIITDKKPKGEKVFEYEVLGKQEDLPGLLNSGIKNCIIGIGDNKIREEKMKYALNIGFKFISAIHPFSSIGRDVVIDEGSIIHHGAVVDPCVHIGKADIINDNSVVGHNSVLGDFTHISAGACFGGNCRIGSCSFVGMGATVISGINIGNNVFIGAGSVVTKDISDNSVVCGMPARIIKKREQI